MDSKSLISLLATGIVIWFESAERNKNLAFIPRQLKRGLNILAGRYSIVIKDRTDMVETFSKEIGTWFEVDNMFSGEKLIEDGIPSDFAYEIAADRYDTEGELDQIKIIDVLKESSLFGKEEDYVDFRRFLIENPISSKDKIKKYIREKGRYYPEMQKTYSKLYEFYEEVPDRNHCGGKLKICSYCGWTLLEKKGSIRCVSNICRALGGVEKYKELCADGAELRLKRGAMKFISLPGKPEIEIMRKIEKLGLKVRLWPEFDKYDLEIEFDNERWAVDVKDYSNPHVLVGRIKEFPINDCQKAIVVVPRRRCLLDKSFKYVIDAENPEGFTFMTERALFKAIKEKISDEKL